MENSVEYYVFGEGGPVDVLAEVAFILAHNRSPCEAIDFPCPLFPTCDKVPRFSCWKVFAVCCYSSSVITEK